MSKLDDIFGLKDKVCFVTGASVGIGRAVAIGMAPRSGADVAPNKLPLRRTHRCSRAAESMTTQDLPSHCPFPALP